MEKLTMPSKVMDKDYIRKPEKVVLKSDVKWSRCGKWVLTHPDADLGFVDSAWTALQQLLDDGTLLMLKASTAKMAKEGATIMCYTRPGKQEAKLAVEAIRRVVDFFGIIYYRLNKKTYVWRDIRFGDESVSIYMQTFLGSFYTKKDRMWKLDIDDGAEDIMSISSKFNRNNYPGNKKLLSNCEDHCFWNSPENHGLWVAVNAKWYTFCSCEDEGDYLSEADRVWLVANQLLKEGLFVGISIVKLKYAKCAELRLYVSLHCDVDSRLSACDRLFKEASFKSVLYFAETAGSEILYTRERRNTLRYEYKYTSSEELYRMSEYCDE